MADVSKITLPNGNTYDIKDAVARENVYNVANRSICPYYSTSETYAVGDKVRYGDYIYECITAITTAEAWTAAHWEIAPTLQEQLTSLSDDQIDIKLLASTLVISAKANKIQLINTTLYFS